MSENGSRDDDSSVGGSRHHEVKRATLSQLLEDDLTENDEEVHVFEEMRAYSSFLGGDDVPITGSVKNAFSNETSQPAQPKKTVPRNAPSKMGQIRTPSGMMWQRYEFPGDKSPRCLIGKNFFRLNFNPIVVLLTVVAFAVFPLILRQKRGLETVVRFVSDNFKGFYVLTNNLWVFFMVWLFFSEYSSIRLGMPGDNPDYDDLSWFTMVFCTSLGAGMYFYGASEPVNLYAGFNSFSVDYSQMDNQLAHHALTSTMHHWGKYYFSFF